MALVMVSAKNADSKIMSAKFKKKNSLDYSVKNSKANTVDSDETAHYEPSHVDLQYLQIQVLLCLAL